MTEDTSQQQSNGQVDASDFEIEAPDRTRPDEPIPVRILGASPNEVVEFEAAMEDEDGIEWRSTATFRATGEGIVDPPNTHPSQDPMGVSDPWAGIGRWRPLIPINSSRP